jgi:hypothetical protein
MNRSKSLNRFIFFYGVRRCNFKPHYVEKSSLIYTLSMEPVKDRKYKMTDFVRPNHRNEIKQHSEILDQMDPEKKHARCVVIDFKDKSKRYDCIDDISATEEDFAAFFRGNGHEKKEIQADIYNLFKECRINFFINEGSLKADLLKKAFKANQADFFQSGVNGSRMLCQLCEVIMNGFKQGCEIVVNECQFNPVDYISVINDPTPDGREDLPSIRLLTLYPRCYKDTYALGSAYYQLITRIFKTTHEKKNETTIITIQ